MVRTRDTTLRVRVSWEDMSSNTLLRVEGDGCVSARDKGECSCTHWTILGVRSVKEDEAKVMHRGD